MRFIALLKATEASEAGQMPSQQLLREMGQFNQALIDAGVLVDGNGLQPSTRGARIRLSGHERTVSDGPFPRPHELVSGYWVLQVKSKQEAIDWIKRCPNPHDGESEIELRQIFEAEDFANLPPEVKEQEERFRKR